MHNEIRIQRLQLRYSVAILLFVVSKESFSGEDLVYLFVSDLDSEVLKLLFMRHIYNEMLNEPLKVSYLILIKRLIFLICRWTYSMQKDSFPETSAHSVLPK